MNKSKTVHFRAAAASIQSRDRRAQLHQVCSPDDRCPLVTIVTMGSA